MANYKIVQFDPLNLDDIGTDSGGLGCPPHRLLRVQEVDGRRGAPRSAARRGWTRSRSAHQEDVPDRHVVPNSRRRPQPTLRWPKDHRRGPVQTHAPVRRRGHRCILCEGRACRAEMRLHGCRRRACATNIRRRELRGLQRQVLRQAPRRQTASDARGNDGDGPTRRGEVNPAKPTRSRPAGVGLRQRNESQATGMGDSTTSRAADR